MEGNLFSSACKEDGKNPAPHTRDARGHSKEASPTTFFLRHVWTSRKKLSLNKKWTSTKTPRAALFRLRRSSATGRVAESLPQTRAGKEDRRPPPLTQSYTKSRKTDEQTESERYGEMLSRESKEASRGKGAVRPGRRGVFVLFWACCYKSASPYCPATLQGKSPERPAEEKTSRHHTETTTRECSGVTSRSAERFRKSRGQRSVSTCAGFCMRGGGQARRRDPRRRSSASREPVVYIH